MDMSSMSGMSGMSGDGANSSSMAAMGVFFASSNSALFSASWTPGSRGAYAGTCIFVIVLAVIFRLLLAAKSQAEARWLDAELARRYVVVTGRPTLAEQIVQDPDAKRGTLVLSANGLEEDVVVLQKRQTNHVRPWRLSIDPLRAVGDMVIAGVSYLLMMAVMTGNVGYFMSVLGGTFLGSLLVGRYVPVSEH